MLLLFYNDWTQRKEIINRFDTKEEKEKEEKRRIDSMHTEIASLIQNHFLCIDLARIRCL